MFSLTDHCDDETWLIEAGDLVIKKMAHTGMDSLTRWERLVYCIWVADYGMRNAGDLEVSGDVYADFQSAALQISSELSLRLTVEAFSLTKHSLEREYFSRFHGICSELRSVSNQVY